MSDDRLINQLDVLAPEPTSRAYDAIVIGAGVSGLTSAVILAKEGLRVLVLEQHDRIGGYLHRFFRKGGVQFDVGFHYVGGVEPGQILARYLEYCGVYDCLELIPFDQDGFDELSFPNRRFRVPAGYPRLRERLCEAFPTETAVIDSYCRALPEVVNGFAFYRLHGEQNLEHVDRWMSTSLTSFLSALSPSPGLAAVLCGQSPLYGVEPRRTPMALHALVTDTYMQHAYTFAGGGDRLAQLMGQRVADLGGELQTRQRVVAILVDDAQRAIGVRTERGDEFRASLVVSAVNPKVTLSLLPEKCTGAAYRRRLTSMEDGLSTFSIYVTTRRDLSRYWGRNIYRYLTPDIEGVYAASKSGAKPRFAFITVPSAREGVSPDGRHQVIAFTLMPWARVSKWANTRRGERGADYEELKAGLAEEMLAMTVDSLPELEGAVESLEAATPLTNRDYTLNSGGAAYGLNHNIEQSGRRGLKPRTRVKGLHLTGQSILFPGVCGATISAFHTAAGILGADYLMGRVNRGS